MHSIYVGASLVKCKFKIFEIVITLVHSGMSEWEAHFEIFGGCPNLFSGDLPGFAKGCLCIIMRALEVEPVVRIPYVISTPRHTRLKLVHT